MIGVDEGKMRLDDSPRKFLPYFRLRDPDADAKVTLGDLLAHRSGLNRTDLAMLTGRLNREELIRVAGTVKPTAKLGERFMYQNVMYAAAGESVARAYNTTWEQFTQDRLLTPLGMSASVLTVAEMRRRPDHATGYDLDMETRQATPIPMRDIAAAAPAGAINSNARDMARWLRFQLAGTGAFNGRRIVSERGLRTTWEKRNTVGGTIGYGLGWFLRDWNGHKVIEHGGNIDGFNASVGLMPDQRLGFVLLTNVSSSPLGPGVLNLVWSNLVGDPNAPSAGNVPAKTAALAGSSDPAVSPQVEAGVYQAKVAGQTIVINVAWDKTRLVMRVPGQPPYPLQRVSGRRYKLGAPRRAASSPRSGPPPPRGATRPGPRCIWSSRTAISCLPRSRPPRRRPRCRRPTPPRAPPRPRLPPPRRGTNSPRRCANWSEPTSATAARSRWRQAETRRR
jgi:CubicO group peptidase (beta-lactamase class C family)